MTKNFGHLFDEMEPTLPLMLRTRVLEQPGVIAQYAKDATGRFTARTYQQFYDEIRDTAAGLLDLGAKRGDPVGLISDNRQEWLVSDFGILSIGAADVPRGGDSTPQELVYILGSTECKISFAENQKQTEKIISIKKELPFLSVIITYDPVDDAAIAAAREQGITVYYYPEVMARGKKRRAVKPLEVEEEMDKGKREDVSTIIFTSGTTGEPKGVVLTHGTFLHQLPSFPAVFEVKPGDIWLSVLPVWHVFERAIEYVIFYLRSGIAYSKPIASILMADFQAIRPQWMVSVPRVWEAIMDGIYRTVKQQGGLRKTLFDFCVSFGLMYTYFKDLTFRLLPNYHGRIRVIDSVIGFFPWLLLLPGRAIAAALVFKGIKARLGGRFVAGISGGGALPPKVDHFFNAVGIRMQEGYGLTETSPIVAVRQARKARRGTVGQMLLKTEARIMDGKGKILPPGHNGVVYIKGGQVMKGYYKKPEATAAILSDDGWLNTGDIGMLTRDNELRLTGRAKDTIVLRGGENVEPVPIENKLKESDFISQCMVVGQDQKYLAALIIPVQESVMAFAEENNIPIVDYDLLLQQPEVNEIISTEVADLVGPKTGFKPFERIYKFRLLSAPFKPGEELSGKQELLRHKIAARCHREIQGLFKG
ncbi:long-chain-fatty-acid--CoA ligase [Spirochaetia bacterium]|nr:long-chain-fatty-acid--CoA ligase [Spirochaetia bacterium]